MSADEQSARLAGARVPIDATRIADLASFARFPDLAMCRIEARDWLGYLVLFGVPSLSAAFLRILPELNGEPPEVYWSLLGQVWNAAEAPSLEEGVDWRALFADPRPNREYLMGVDDKRAYRCLPGIVHVYRGAGHPEFLRGLSWTLDHERATWFADHAGTVLRRSRVLQHRAAADAQEPCVAHGLVARADVIAVLSGDRSTAVSEIIALPETIDVVMIERLERARHVPALGDESASRQPHPLRSARQQFSAYPPPQTPLSEPSCLGNHQRHVRRGPWTAIVRLFSSGTPRRISLPAPSGILHAPAGVGRVGEGRVETRHARQRP